VTIEVDRKCMTCDGTGCVVDAQTKDDQHAHPCRDCLGKSLCPLCGGPVIFEADVFDLTVPLSPVCEVKCGWQYGE
jgi:hypothetical protein